MSENFEETQNSSSDKNNVEKKNVGSSNATDAASRSVEAEPGGRVVSDSTSSVDGRSEADATLQGTTTRADGVSAVGRSALDRLGDIPGFDRATRVRTESKKAPEIPVEVSDKERRDIERARKKKSRKRIDFRFRAVIDENDKVEFVDVYQILNDVYLGKMNVMNYFFIAENSQRINELNFIAIHELALYQKKVMERHGVEPIYCLPLTTRFLDDNEELFATLLNNVKGNGWLKGKIMFSFNALTLENLGPEIAEPWLKKLRKAGYKIVVDGFGEEYNSLDLFADFTFEYLRLSALYFDKTPQKANLLTMLLKYAKSNKFKVILTDVKTKGQYNRYKKLGVKLMSGKAVSRMSRFVTKRFLRQ